MRYGFNAPTIWVYEFSFMVNGAAFMLGCGYALYKGAHVRTDIYWENFSERTKGIIDMISYILLFYPVMITFMVVSFDATLHSYDTGERSQESVWRAIMWPFRATVPLAAVLVHDLGRLRSTEVLVPDPVRTRVRAQGKDRDMTGSELLGLFMLLVMLGAIFIGLPISFTLLFLAGVFGYIGMGERVLSLAYLQTIGIMKQDELVAVPMFILMGLYLRSGRADGTAVQGVPRSVRSAEGGAFHCRYRHRDAVRHRGGNGGRDGDAAWHHGRPLIYAPVTMCGCRPAPSRPAARSAS